MFLGKAINVKSSNGIRYNFFLLFISSENAVYAMHITEGILPPKWVITWFAVAMPFVGIGIYHVKQKKRQMPVYLPLVGTLGAAVFVFSCFPIPVIALNGMATSHPCGTGMSAVLLGAFRERAGSSHCITHSGLIPCPWWINHARRKYIFHGYPGFVFRLFRI